MRQIIVFAAMVFGIAAIVPRLYTGDAPAAASVNVATATSNATQAAAAARTATITRSNGGHFQTEAVIDGRRMDFMVDTGASLIALRERDASRIGIHPMQSDYTAKVSTANGTVLAARVALNRVEVGNVVVYNVAALVLPDQALAQNLLGMSFLSRLRWEQKNGRLVLEQ
jgi:aspartyl protease family protein